MSTVPVVELPGHTHVWATWPYRPGVPDPQTRGSVENLLHEMDASGVDHAVVVSTEIDGAAGNNDHGASVVAQHPGRFSQLVDLDSHFGPDYHRPGSADRLRAVVDRYAPVGVSHYLAAEDDGWLGSTGGDAFLAVAEEAGVVVNLAARPVWGPAIRGAARRHPGVTILLNHLGTVMLHPGGPRGGAPAGRRRRGPAQPRRQGLRLGLRHRPALGLPVRGPARRRPPVPRGVGSGPARLGIGLAVAAAAPQLPPGPGVPH